MRTKKEIHSQKNITSISVADQPGRAIFFSGLLIALVFGLLIRGALAPERVKRLVEKAAGQVHQDFQFQIDEAYLSLSRGGVPGLELTIKRVHVQSQSACWMMPRVFIDEVRLPLSLMAIVFGKAPFSQVIVGEMAVRLGSERKGCDEGQEIKESSRGESAGVKSAKIVSLVNKSGKFGQENRSIQQGQIESIVLRRLRIQRDDGISQEWDFLNVDLEKTSPHTYGLKAKTKLIEGSADSVIQAEYKSFPEKNLMIHLFGHWREGSYSLIARKRMTEEDFSVDADFRYVPISQFLKLIKQSSIKFNPRQAWMSFNAKLTGKGSGLSQVQGEFENIRIEGDIGDLHAPKVRVLNLEPFAFQDFKMDVRRLNLDKVGDAFSGFQKTKFLSSMGDVQGMLEVGSNGSGRFQGKLSGMGLIFSHHGRRENQVIESMNVVMKLQDQKIQAYFSDIIPLGGRFEGDIKASANLANQSAELGVRMDKFQVSRLVQNIYGQSGQLGDIGAHLMAQWKSGVLSSARAQLSMEDFKDGVNSFGKLQSKFELKNNLWTVNTQFGQLSSDPDSFLVKLFSLKGPLSLAKVQSKATLSLAGDELLNMTARGQLVEPFAGTFSLSGKWNELGEVSGKVQLNQKNRQLNYLLSGTRSQPQVSESK